MPNVWVTNGRPPSFYGWTVVGTAFVTLGLAVGIPYYNLPFFYDYFQKAHGWGLAQITLGFPLAALLTLWVAPLVIPRFRQRTLIAAGTALSALSFALFAGMGSSFLAYLFIYLIYTTGYIVSGPIPHQILLSHWFRAKRGFAMGVMYVGVGLVGGLGSYLVRGVTDRYGFRAALVAAGAVLLITIPLALSVLRDRPSDVGQFADGASEPTPDSALEPRSYRELFRSLPFWLLLIGSMCSIGSIGSINQHMKFVLRDQGFATQVRLNAAWTTASAFILWSSIAGRLVIGYLADVASKKLVMAATYFVVAVTILLLLSVRPERPLSLYMFAAVFGFAMGADYMLIPLMAAEQFGLNSLARAMAIILPINTIGQTWCPYLVSALRERAGTYGVPMLVVFGIAMTGAAAIALLPRKAIAVLATR